MADLSPEEVRRQAQAVGLVITDEDLPEVTVRLNTLSEALEGLEHPDMDTVEPRFVFKTPRY